MLCEATHFTAGREREQCAPVTTGHKRPHMEKTLTLIDSENPVAKKENAAPQAGEDDACDLKHGPREDRLDCCWGLSFPSSRLFVVVLPIAKMVVLIPF